MSVREEDKNKNCPSRGLGIAAAAIGVGVGAALYYYFSKRPENPADEGASTSGWNCDQHVLQHDPDSSYTTISEHSTTDTSIHDSSSSTEDEQNRSNYDIMQAISRRLWNDSTDEDVSEAESISEYSINSDHDNRSPEWNVQMLNGSNSGNIESDSETNMEWDVTTSSLDVPRDQPRSGSPMMLEFGELTVSLLNPQNTPWKSARERMNLMRDQAFRERAWTLEECSICFEGMLKEQEVLALDCTHRFHQACIMPWLQEQQTCPNCRKAT